MKKLLFISLLTLLSCSYEEAEFKANPDDSRESFHMEGDIFTINDIDLYGNDVKYKVYEDSFKMTGFVNYDNNYNLMIIVEAPQSLLLNEEETFVKSEGGRLVGCVLDYKYSNPIWDRAADEFDIVIEETVDNDKVIQYNARWVDISGNIINRASGYFIHNMEEEYE